jgi:hypothetical protein
MARAARTCSHAGILLWHLQYGSDIEWHVRCHDAIHFGFQTELPRAGSVTRQRRRGVDAPRPHLTASSGLMTCLRLPTPIAHRHGFSAASTSYQTIPPVWPQRRDLIGTLEKSRDIALRLGSARSALPGSTRKPLLDHANELIDLNLARERQAWAPHWVEKSTGGEGAAVGRGIGRPGRE